MKTIEKAIKEGSAIGRINGKEYTVEPKNMPLLMELYLHSRRIGVSPSQLAPLLANSNYLNGKHISKQSVNQWFNRGKDPENYIVRETIQTLNTLLKKLQAKKVFGNKKDSDTPLFESDYYYIGDYPKRGSEFIEFIKSNLS